LNGNLAVAALRFVVIPDEVLEGFSFSSAIEDLKALSRRKVQLGDIAADNKTLAP